ncbi:MAG: ABC transporter substrate-binding protein, partial [Acidobacteriota bacterium]
GADAVDLLARRPDDPAAAEAALALADTAWHARRGDDARHHVERGLDLARASGAKGALHRLLTLGATIANLRGEHGLARAYLDEAGAAEAAAIDDGVNVPRGGRLRVGLATEVHAVDPAMAHTKEQVEVAMAVFEPLLVADQGHPVAGLATEWVERDGALELTLRPGVRFSDGRPLDAAIVCASFARLARQRRLAPPPLLAALEGFDAFERGESEHLTGIEVLAPDRLRLRPTEPLPILPSLLTHASTAIVHGGPAGPLGTGPFRVASEGVDAGRVVLEPNPSWRGSRPPLDAVELATGLDAAALAEGLRDGGLDLVGDLFPDDLEALLADPVLHRDWVEAPQRNLYFVLLNHRGPTTADASVREALAGVLRGDDLAWRVLGRFAQPAVSRIPPGLLGHDAGRRRPRLDPAVARQRLDEAGLRRPCLRAAVHPLLRERYGLLTLRLFDAWQALDCDVEVEDLSMDAFRNAYRDNDHLDILVGRWIADINDPDDFTHGFFHSRAGRFRRWYASEAADALVETARKEADPDQRARLYGRFETLLDQEAVCVPLFHDLDVLIAGARVRGLRHAIRPPYLHYEHLAVETASRPVPAERRLGGALDVALSGRVETLDPIGDNVSATVEVVPCIFDTLTRVGDGARPEPWLAEGVESLDGGRRFRIVLRRQARFHGGRRVEARDVRSSFERLLRHLRSDLHFLLLPIRGARALRDGQAEHLAGLTVVSDRELVIELERPLAIFPALLSHPLVSVVAEDAECFDASFRDGCVGTGPFRVLRFVPGERLELERDPDHWRQDRPLAERLTFHFDIGPDAMRDRFRAGALSLASDLRPVDADALRRDPKYVVGYHEQPRLATYFLILIGSSDVFRDRSARRAFARALGRSKDLAASAGRLAIPAYGLIPPGLVGAVVDDPGPWFESRSEPGSGSPSPSLAEQVLPRDVRVAVHPVFVGQYVTFWRQLVEQVRTAGTAVDAITLEPALALDRARGGGVDMLA